MKAKTGLIGMACLLAACGGGAGETEAQAEDRSGPTRPSLDVAGLRPGMQSNEARRLLDAAGWKVETEAGEDWNATVDHEIKRQRNVFPIEEPKRGVASITANKDDEEIFAQMRPQPAGDVVTTVRYTAPKAGRSTDELRAQMTRRYGAADRSAGAGLPVDMTWCSAGERCRDAYGAAKPALGVREQSSGKLVIYMGDGSEADRVWRAALDKAVAARSGSKASF